eukprot:TRINITY_DN506_c1_g1_i1.p1 TRINITY_DN506_c1_g1~~TRINITY_DN506_c1_g1_i1.p1  ORF type:complete len:141 (-),score=33.26 TRINITY_DN506_c1_g1_i1:31-399(-)
MEGQSYYTSEILDTNSNARHLKRASWCVVGVGIGLIVLVAILVVAYMAYSQIVIAPHNSLHGLGEAMVMLIGGAIIFIIFVVTLIIFGILRFFARSYVPEVVYISSDEFQGLSNQSYSGFEA